MEFWGVEAKPGQTLDCDPGEEKYIHLSQLAIGENARENERVSVYVHFEGKKIMLGTFTHGICDQIGLDLVFEKKFQISHTSKSAAVFCSGYTTYIQDEDDDVDSEDEEEMVEAAFPTKENGGKLVPKALKTDSKEAKQEAKDAKQAVAKPGKPDKGSNGKPQAAKPPTKEAVRDEDSDDEDDDDSENDEDSEDEAVQDASESDEDDEDDEDDDDSDDEEEETPKVKDGKKRLAPNSAAKTPVTDKKAKLITPEGQKQGDAKKNVHVATPHPGAKQGGKKGKETPGTSKPQTPAKETPKSATPGSGKKLGQFTCQPCKRNFNTETGLSSHNAAKHGEK